MFEPHLDFKFDHKALPPLWHVTSLVLSTALVGAIFFETFSAAAQIFA